MRNVFSIKFKLKMGIEIDIFSGVSLSLDVFHPLGLPLFENARSWYVSQVRPRWTFHPVPLKTKRNNKTPFLLLLAVQPKRFGFLDIPKLPPVAL